MPLFLCDETGYFEVAQSGHSKICIREKSSRSFRRIRKKDNLVAPEKPWFYATPKNIIALWYSKKELKKGRKSTANHLSSLAKFIPAQLSMALSLSPSLPFNLLRSIRCSRFK